MFHRDPKRLFYRAFNAMFGKVGRCVYPKMKCLPVLFYELEFYPLNKTQIKSHDFAIKN